MAPSTGSPLALLVTCPEIDLTVCGAGGFPISVISTDCVSVPINGGFDVAVMVIFALISRSEVKLAASSNFASRPFWVFAPLRWHPEMHRRFGLLEVTSISAVSSTARSYRMMVDFPASTLLGSA
ncbi:MAG TPA: hypothetical protein VF174_03580 [Micromonosporaceae bacterium]